MTFNKATRQNMYPQASLPYVSDREVYVDIARVGFLATVKLRFSGTLTAKHASKTTFTKAPTAPWNIANRISLVMNTGTSIWNTSGYGAYLQNVINKFHYCMDEVVSGSSVFQFGNTVSSTGAANPIDFSLDLNVSINDRDAIGLIMLQSDNMVCTAKISNAPASVLMNDTDVDAVLDGTWFVSVETFSIPENVADYPSLSHVHSVQEERFPITALGENRLIIPRGNIYMRIINSVTLNGVPNGAYVDQLALKYNLHTEPYKLYGADMLAMQRQRYQRDLPAGAFVWDFFYQGLPDLGSDRDFIDSADIMEFDEFIRIGTGATLGSNNNYVTMVRDMLMPVEVSR